MNTYIRFLKLLKAISDHDQFPQINPTSKVILEVLALHESEGNPLSVSDLLEFNKIASPATLHKHLAKLRRLGYVSAISSEKDKRSKFLILSATGKSYFRKLSQAIHEASVES